MTDLAKMIVADLTAVTIIIFIFAFTLVVTIAFWPRILKGVILKLFGGTVVAIMEGTVGSIGMIFRRMLPSKTKVKEVTYDTARISKDVSQKTADRLDVIKDKTKEYGKRGKEFVKDKTVELGRKAAEGAGAVKEKGAELAEKAAERSIKETKYTRDKVIELSGSGAATLKHKTLEAAEVFKEKSVEYGTSAADSTAKAGTALAGGTKKVLRKIRFPNKPQKLRERKTWCR